MQQKLLIRCPRTIAILFVAATMLTLINRAWRNPNWNMVMIPTLMRDRRRDIPPRAKNTQETDAIPGTQFYSYWLLPPCQAKKLHPYNFFATTCL